MIQASIRNNAQTSSLWLSIPLVPAITAVAAFLAASPVSRHAVEQLPVGGFGGRRLVDDNNVHSAYLRLVLSKRLPDDALYSISTGRLPAVFFRYRQAQPGVIEVILPGEYRKPFIAATRGFFEHAAERLGIEQPVLFLEPVNGAACQVWGAAGSGGLLGRELGAALGATALQHEAPGFRRHTGTKTVCACTLDLAWLIRTFHLSGSWFFRRPRHGLRSGRAARVRTWQNAVNRAPQTVFRDRRRPYGVTDMAALRQTL